MYAKGMSQRDIEDTLREIYGAEISQGLVSRITDKILPEVNDWQNRPLDKIYPVVFFDGIVFNSRKDNKIISKCVYSVLGINMEGQKEILGTWISEIKGISAFKGKFWNSMAEPAVGVPQYSGINPLYDELPDAGTPELFGPCLYDFNRVLSGNGAYRGR